LSGFKLWQLRMSNFTTNSGISVQQLKKKPVHKHFCHLGITYPKFMMMGLLFALLVGTGAVVALQNSNSVVEANSTVQVAVASDSKNMPIVRTLLNSVRVNSPRTLVNVIHLADATVDCQELLKSPALQSIARCVEWDSQQALKAASLIKVVAGERTEACSGLEGCDAMRAKRLKNVLNFARFFLSDILPDLSHVIWLDTDVVVTKSMGDVWSTILASDANSLMSAFVEDVRFGRFYLDPRRILKLMALHFHADNIDLEGVSFNDGVLGVNLEKWRTLQVGSDLEWLMMQHHAAQPGLWKYGTQPIMMLLGVAYGWQQLDSKRYCGDLGFKNVPVEKWTDATFLHFDGEKKPWRSDGLNKELWERYASLPLGCESSNSSCTIREMSGVASHNFSS